MSSKLKDQRGETLTEVLAAVLVSAISVALLFGGVMASASVEDQARKWDTAYYGALSAAEGRAEMATPPVDTGFKLKVTTNAPGVLSQEVGIQVYGQKGAWSYAKAEGTGP